jgi:hypothetical protein
MVKRDQERLTRKIRKIIIGRILGPEESIHDYSKEGHPSQGLMFRSVRYLFQKMLRLSTKNTDYFVNASFIEIYNEQVIDLLNDRKNQNLNFRYNKEDVSRVMKRVFSFPI